MLSLRNYVFLCCLFCLSLTDWDSMRIPDGCLLTAVLAWVAALLWGGQGWGAWGSGLLAALLLGGGMLGLSGVLDRLLGRESLGGGDVKLFAVVGLYLGLVGSLFAAFFSSVLGLLTVFLLGWDREKPIPFAPAISAAAALMLLFGEPLVMWYADFLH